MSPARDIRLMRVRSGGLGAIIGRTGEGPMDIAEWLRGLGLAQYEPAFRENAIDDTVLPSLTAEDLKDLGVGIVGHRRKLLDAMAALRADATTKVPLSDTLPTI